MLNRFSFGVFTFLYRHAFFIYKPLYYFFKKYKDRHEIALMKQLIRPGMTVLDIGSNIGFYSELFSELVGEHGRVHCFEPDRDNFRHLQKAVGHKKNVTLNNAAVSEHDGEITIYTSHRLNVDHRTYEPEQYQDKYQVKCICIDNYLAAETEVGFIKMDIQGAEYQAVKGMKQLLQRSVNLSILSEFAPLFLEGSEKGAADKLIPLLSSFGCITYRIYDRSLTKYDTAGNDWRKEAAKVNTDFYFNILVVKGNDEMINNL
jgi:FkbM family methyltransferase